MQVQTRRPHRHRSLHQGFEGRVLRQVAQGSLREEKVLEAGQVRRGQIPVSQDHQEGHEMRAQKGRVSAMP